MKKVFVIIVALSFVLAFASCKKEYTCECTYTGFVYGEGNVEKTSEVVYEGTKKYAEESCDDFEETMKSLHGDSASCKLK